MTKEKEEPAVMVRGVPWALWLSSGLVIALLLFSTVMLMVTPTDSASQFQPLVRPRSTTLSDETPETATDEEVQQKISELFKRKGYSNPDPDPEDQLEDSGPQISTRIGHTQKRRTRRPLQKIGKDFDASQSYVIKHANGTITYVFPEKVLKGNGNAALVAETEDKKPTEKDVVQFRTPSSNSSDFVFPSDSEPSPDVKPVAGDKDEPCSPDYPICNNVEDYPHEKINDIVAQYKQKYAGVFGEDVVVPAGDTLVTRNGFSDDTPLCVSVENLIHPQRGFTKTNQNLTIVNTKEYRQGVRVEICSQPGQVCNELQGFMGSQKVECKQLYHYRTLLAIDPVTKEPYKESFKLPSCCKCVIKPPALLNGAK